jgi:hypothetical protein
MCCTAACTGGACISPFCQWAFVPNLQHYSTMFNLQVLHCSTAKTGTARRQPSRIWQHVCAFSSAALSPGCLASPVAALAAQPVHFKHTHAALLWVVCKTQAPPASSLNSLTSSTMHHGDAVSTGNILGNCTGNPGCQQQCCSTLDHTQLLLAQYCALPLPSCHGPSLLAPADKAMHPFLSHATSASERTHPS